MATSLTLTKMRILLTLLMAVATFLSVEAYSYSYSFNNTPISEALVRISKDHPDVNISFIYKELDNYRTSARINTDDAYRTLRQIVGLHPISVINKNGSFYIEALQHGRFVYTGSVIGSDNDPVAGATVMLLNPNDSTLITYSIANGEGRFTIPCDRMDVIAKLSCIGYNTVYTRSSGFNLGTIVMPVNTIILQQVSISSTKPFVKLKGTGFSIDIANSHLGDLPTVPDVLSQLPSVKATGSGFSVLGRGDAEIFIGNQKVVDMSELYRLRPAEIKSVEIIRNPGAEFNADAAAVIRIRLKNNVLKGFGLDVMSQGSFGRRFSDYEQLSITYGAGRTNSFLTFSNNSSRLNSDQDNQQDTYTSSGIWKMTSEMPHWNSEYYDWMLTAGTSVSVTDNHTVGAKVTYSHDTQRNGGEKYSAMTIGDEEYETLVAYTSTPQNYWQWHANVYYDGTFSEKWSAVFNGDYVGRKHYSEHFTEENGSLTPHHLVINNDNTRYNLWSALAKVNWKLTDSSQMVFGTDISVVRQHRNDWQSGQEQISQLNSVESKYAVFGQYNLSRGIWDFGAGIRYEANKMDYTDGSTDSKILFKTYHRLYPEITVSANVGKTIMSLGFTSHIRRPSFYQLRTSREYFNRYETTEGNPLLRPRYTYDISYSFGYNDFTASVGYQWVHNYISEESRIDSDNPLHLTSYPVNKGKYTAAMLQLNYDHKFGFWHPYLSAHLTKTFYGLSMIQESMPPLGKSPLFELSFSNYFSFCGTTAYISANYNPAGAYCDSWEDRFVGIDLGIYRRFFSKRLYVAVNATNIFGCKSKSRTYYGASIFERTAFRDNQRLYLTISYSFRHDVKYKGKTSAQDEINRM